jgi:hypothetical protein
VGVAENPRSGVGARGSSVKKRGVWGAVGYTLASMALPLLNLLTRGRRRKEESALDVSFVRPGAGRGLFVRWKVPDLDGMDAACGKSPAAANIV